MSTYSKIVLSGSTNGAPIAVQTAATTIHDAHASDTDEVWIWATNVTTGDVKLTMQIGGTAAANLIEYTVPAEDGLHLIIPGIAITGGVDTDAICPTNGDINIVGYVNRIT